MRLGYAPDRSNSKMMCAGPGRLILWPASKQKRPRHCNEGNTVAGIEQPSRGRIRYTANEPNISDFGSGG